MARLTNLKRKQRLEVLMETLRNGEEVAKRDFDLAVGKQHAKLYASRWLEQMELRKLKVPDEVKGYEQILQEALMMYGRAEQFNVQKGGTNQNLIERQKILEELSNKAESLFEDALTRLEEIISEDEGLRVWFDRDLCFGAGSDFSFSPGGMPRLITSKSPENLAKADRMKRFGWQTKAEVKLSVIQEALDELDINERGIEIAEEEKIQAGKRIAKLKGLLANLGKQG